MHLFISKHLSYIDSYVSKVWTLVSNNGKAYCPPLSLSLSAVTQNSAQSISLKIEISLNWIDHNCKSTRSGLSGCIYLYWITLFLSDLTFRQRDHNIIFKTSSRFFSLVQNSHNLMLWINDSSWVLKSAVLLTLFDLQRRRVLFWG